MKKETVEKEKAVKQDMKKEKKEMRQAFHLHSVYRRRLYNKTPTVTAATPNNATNE